MTKCQECDGTGMNALGDLPCLTCNGRGEVPDPVPTEPPSTGCKSEAREMTDE